MTMIGHEYGTTRYHAWCIWCGWSGPIHQVSSTESAPNMAAVVDGWDHERRRHPVRRRLRDVLKRLRTGSSK